MKWVISLLLVSTLVMISCYRDVEEELYGGAGGTCNTSGVTYTAVNAMLQNSGCISCHSGSAPSGGISLQGYANVRTTALNGKLYGTISYAAGYSPMPKGGNKMSACDISKIKAWIDAGIPNN